MTTEEFFDGGLLNKARQGDREAIAALCAIVAATLRNDGRLTFDPDVIALFADILTRIGAGDSPDDAFGWGRGMGGRPNRDYAFRDWQIRCSVRDLMRGGHSRRAACKLVSADRSNGGTGDVPLGAKTIEAICADITADSDLPMPLEIFPVNGLLKVPILPGD